MASIQGLERFPHAGLIRWPTPLEPLKRLSEDLGIEVWIKRDDLTGLGFGGNKVRQLDYYLGAALAQNADTILITGAVQSNYARSAAACAARLGMRAIIQLEDRVPGMGETYHRSGNVLLDVISGAEVMHYSKGEDEAGADAALRARAEELRQEGRSPYVIPLGVDNPPLGALGYMRCAREICDHYSGFDAFVVASGSGATHAGLLAGLRAVGSRANVHGVCVRRDAMRQTTRLLEVRDRLSTLFGCDSVYSEHDLNLCDQPLAPGYGRLGPPAREAMIRLARLEGLYVDPVYTAKALAGLFHLAETDVITKGSRVCFVHTGGLAALFAYGDDLRP